VTNNAANDKNITPKNKYFLLIITPHLVFIAGSDEGWDGRDPDKVFFSSWAGVMAFQDVLVV
jgi:hypothetical protein